MIAKRGSKRFSLVLMGFALTLSALGVLHMSRTPADFGRSSGWISESFAAAEPTAVVQADDVDVMVFVHQNAGVGI